MTLELKKALSFHLFCILFCKLVERLNAKPFSCVFYTFKCVICIFSLLSSLLKAFNLTKNSCVCTLCFKCACQCAFVFFFSSFHIYWKISKCSILYVALPPLHLTPTIFNVIEIFIEQSNYCAFIPSLIFVKCLICYITFIALLQVCQQFSKCLVCYLFTSPISL
jgi:hypothetical protein